MKLSRTELVDALQVYHGYTPAAAKRTANRVLNTQPQVQEAFWRWWGSQTFSPELMVQGLTAESLMTQYGLKPIGAFLTLDWLLRDPEAALRTLRRGFDHIR